MMIANVAIIGLGLIGGSLGLALKDGPTSSVRGDPAPSIAGWDQDASACMLAQARGAIDRIYDSPDAAVDGADLVIVAVPVLAVREVLRVIAPALDAKTVVTDVASTKATVCAWARELLPETFIGGHPMAGSERSGVGSARADLFAGATYCLTPLPSTTDLALETATALVRAVGARPHVLDPELHDRAVAAISHLPFLLSTLLVETASASPDWQIFRALAATGFRDVSRLASGDPRMHRDICLTNATEIRSWLREAARMLETFASELDDEPALLERFEHAKRVRDELVGEPSHTSDSGGIR
jgi:prephenate dehydrogenase